VKWCNDGGYLKKGLHGVGHVSWAQHGYVSRVKRHKQVL
jgi:hypothetical protein